MIKAITKLDKIRYSIIQKAKKFDFDQLYNKKIAKLKTELSKLNTNAVVKQKFQEFQSSLTIDTNDIALLLTNKKILEDRLESLIKNSDIDENKKIIYKGFLFQIQKMPSQSISNIDIYDSNSLINLESKNFSESYQQKIEIFTAQFKDCNQVIHEVDKQLNLEDFNNDSLKVALSGYKLKHDYYTPTQLAVLDKIFESSDNLNSKLNCYDSFYNQYIINLYVSGDYSEQKTVDYKREQDLIKDKKNSEYIELESLIKKETRICNGIRVDSRRGLSDYIANKIESFNNEVIFDDEYKKPTFGKILGYLFYLGLDKEIQLIGGQEVWAKKAMAEKKALVDKSYYNSLKFLLVKKNKISEENTVETIDSLCLIHQQKTIQDETIRYLLEKYPNLYYAMGADLCVKFVLTYGESFADNLNKEDIDYKKVISEVENEKNKLINELVNAQDKQSKLLHIKEIIEQKKEENLIFEVDINKKITDFILCEFLEKKSELFDGKELFQYIFEHKIQNKVSDVFIEYFSPKYLVLAFENKKNYVEGAQAIDSISNIVFNALEHEMEDKYLPLLKNKKEIECSDLIPLDFTGKLLRIVEVTELLIKQNKYDSKILTKLHGFLWKVVFSLLKSKKIEELLQNRFLFDFITNNKNKIPKEYDEISNDILQIKKQASDIRDLYKLKSSNDVCDKMMQIYSSYVDLDILSGIDSEIVTKKRNSALIYNYSKSEEDANWDDADVEHYMVVSPDEMLNNEWYLDKLFELKNKAKGTSKEKEYIGCFLFDKVLSGATDNFDDEISRCENINHSLFYLLSSDEYSDFKTYDDYKEIGDSYKLFSGILKTKYGFELSQDLFDLLLKKTDILELNIFNFKILMEIFKGSPVSEKRELNDKFNEFMCNVYDKNDSNKDEFVNLLWNLKITGVDTLGKVKLLSELDKELEKNDKKVASLDCLTKLQQIINEAQQGFVSVDFSITDEEIKTVLNKYELSEIDEFLLPIIEDELYSKVQISDNELPESLREDYKAIKVFIESESGNINSIIFKYKDILRELNKNILIKRNLLQKGQKFNELSSVETTELTSELKELILEVDEKLETNDFKDIISEISDYKNKKSLDALHIVSQFKNNHKGIFVSIEKTVHLSYIAANESISNCFSQVLTRYLDSSNLSKINDIDKLSYRLLEQIKFELNVSDLNQVSTKKLSKEQQILLNLYYIIDNLSKYLSGSDLLGYQKAIDGINNINLLTRNSKLNVNVVASELGYYTDMLRANNIDIEIKPSSILNTTFTDLNIKTKKLKEQFDEFKIGFKNIVGEELDSNTILQLPEKIIDAQRLFEKVEPQYKIKDDLRKQHEEIKELECTINELEETINELKKSINYTGSNPDNINALRLTIDIKSAVLRNLKKELGKQVNDFETYDIKLTDVDNYIKDADEAELLVGEIIAEVAFYDNTLQQCKVSLDEYKICNVLEQFSAIKTKLDLVEARDFVNDSKLNNAFNFYSSTVIQFIERKKILDLESIGKFSKSFFIKLSELSDHQNKDILINFGNDIAILKKYMDGSSDSDNLSDQLTENKIALQDVLFPAQGSIQLPAYSKFVQQPIESQCEDYSHALLQKLRFFGK